MGDLTAPERRSPAAPPEYLEGSGAGQSGFRSKKVRAKDIISPPKEVFFLPRRQNLLGFSCVNEWGGMSVS